jgi:ASC-1-like (ASCH) protein
MKIHELKIWTEYFDSIQIGEKTFELRKNDRGFKDGDTLHLKEWNNNGKYYTGRSILAVVTSILQNSEFGLEKGYCIMSIKVVHNDPFYVYC